MKTIFKFLIPIMVISFLQISCSDDKTDCPVCLSTYTFRMELVRDEMKDLRDNAKYGDKKDMYPAESKYILDDAIIQLEKTIRFIKNGTETDPTQEKVDAAIALAHKAMEEFKATIRTEDLPAEFKKAELLMDGGYIDFGRHAEYSSFGSLGQQQFTVELWLKIKTLSGFGSVVSCFNEDGGKQTRKGWIVNNFGNTRLRMSIGLEGFELLEPGLDFTTTNTWVHFAAVINEKGFEGEEIDGKPVVIKVYLNGELKDKASEKGDFKYLLNDELTSMTGFGQSGGNGDITNDWRLSGSMRDFHIWKSAKSEDDIRKLMNKEIAVTGSETDLVCGWEFTSTVEDDEDIKDLTGKYSAKLVGTYQWNIIE